MHSYFILLLLAFTIALISAKNVYAPEEQRGAIDLNDDYNRFEDLFKMLQYEKNHPREFDRYQKRAKAIVKGDPREFMG